MEAGPLGELAERYETIREAEGFHYSARTRPAVVFRPQGRKAALANSNRVKGNDE